MVPCRPRDFEKVRPPPLQSSTTKPRAAAEVTRKLIVRKSKEFTKSQLNAMLAEAIMLTQRDCLDEFNIF